MLKNSFIALALAAAFAPSISGGGLAPGGNQESIATIIDQADKSYAKRMDLTMARVSYDLYEKAATLDPSNAEALWKAARNAWWLGDHAASKGEKILLFQKTMDWAQSALAISSISINAHFWLGAGMGSFGEVKGILKSLSMVKPIRMHMNEVVRLDPQYDGGAGYRVLGVVDYKVPGFAGGSKKRALDYLTKALELDPANPFNQYYIAEYYDVIGDEKKAKAHLDILEMLQVGTTVDKADLDSMKEKGKKLAARL